jgi:hypothetical protein
MRGAVSVAMVYLHFDRNDRMAAADRHQATLIVSTLTVWGQGRGVEGGWGPGNGLPVHAHPNALP